MVGENEDVVRIMSIHKSKGLEFPVVFVCGLGRNFNKQDTRSRMVLHPELGIGIDWIDGERRIKTPTILKRAIAKQIELENLGEELAAFGFGDGEKCADDKELTLIQGIIDVFWIEEDGIVVLDYKTDRVKTGKELADRYASQLKLYGEALERIYNHGSERTLRVKERLLYSFRLGAVIPV